MKNKEQTAFFITFALCAVLLVVLYMYLYQPYREKTTSLESSNKTLSVRVNQLMQFYAKMPDNQKQIELMTGEVHDILSRFPADVLEEDILHLALQAQNDGAQVRYTNINVDKREELGVIPIETVRAAGMEGLEQQLTFNQRSAVYNNTTGYASLKVLISSMNNNQEELAIKNVSYVYDVESHALNGNVNVTFYTVSGTGKEYEPRTFKDYLSLGHSNLFNAYILVTE